MKGAFSILHLFVMTSVCTYGCGINPTSNTMSDISDTTYAHTNELIHSSSPYLQQHAHNPVNWMPWGDEAFEKAKKEDKLVFISIGYSACHWCHVMEHDTFENEEAAEYINAHFISIKVDREERPDVDQIYMNAVQLMTGRGGWPLNCIALPDGRPIFGGTFFPRKNFIERLEGLVDLKENDKQKMEEYAERLANGVASSELLIAVNDGLARDVKGGPWPRAESNKFGASIDSRVDAWRSQWDRHRGLSNGAPKFPLPTNIDFLLHYGIVRGDNDALSQVRLTLDMMSRGGIYDQAGGGFARYSTDSDWKIPHFEKMLYDNAQLLATYAHAWQVFGEERYKDVCYGIIDFLNNELDDPSGGFRSALDADSDGEEGKYYVWTKEELADALSPSDLELALLAYDIEGRSYWEHGKSVLMSWESDEELSKKASLTQSEFRNRLSSINKTLSYYRDGMEENGNKFRNPRVKPGLDDKVLTSWTALTVTGLCATYRAFNDEEHLERAIKAMNFILQNAKKSDGSLNHVYHSKNGSNINGFLEDYAFTIEACLHLYEATFDPHWLIEARELTLISFDQFYDSETGVFWYTAENDKGLFARKQENDDSVIPSSGSAMARNLFKLGRYDSRLDWIERSDRMLISVWENNENIRRASGWATLLLWRSSPFFELAISAKNYNEMNHLRIEVDSKFRPQIILAGGKKLKGQPSWLDGKYTNSGNPRIFVCQEGACKLPVETLSEVDNLLKVELGK
ncbi:MAG: thioredoxin domain-containing protein [Bacteroidetes bacterium]|nr:MAG: thioredoxin domain-containing protein [Bacteroidota bacterium]